MAHQLAVKDGKGSMAYVEGGAKPWHGYGQVLKKTATIEEWRKAAMMDWEYKAIDICYNVNKQSFVFPGRKAIIRSDNNSPLAIVGTKFKLVQPQEVLNFYKDLTKGGGFKLETAGVLDQGRKIWALASMGKEINIKGLDKVIGYLLLATACDGTFATTAQFTSVRVVCNNTLTYSLYKDGNNTAIPSIKVRHDTKFNAEVVQKQLGIGHKGFDLFAKDINLMAKCKLKTADFDTLMLETFGQFDQDTEKRTVSEQLSQQIDFLYKKGPGSQYSTAKGTAWGWLNAVTYHVDHARDERVEGSRLNSCWFGQGASLKNKAFKNTMELVRN